MTVKEAVSLLSYGTTFEIKGAYSGKTYHNSRYNREENLKKYDDAEVLDDPFYAELCTDRDKSIATPVIGIWVHDYNWKKRKA